MIKKIENTLFRLETLINSRKSYDPSQSYVSYLLYKGDDVVLKKIGEEATEVILAAKNMRQGGKSEHLINEVADLLFHCLVMLSSFNVSLYEIISELENREGVSGIKEKELRETRS